MSDPSEHVLPFRELFTGRTDAYGTGRGRWIKNDLKLAQFSSHLRGSGDGLGVAPLRDDGTVLFASIDLDEPDFECAKEMMRFLPGISWLEESRSGNAHVHAFFDEPIQAWIPRGIMREATAAVGKKTVEVFPKQDKLRPGMLGNYINLPFFGETRPILGFYESGHGDFRETEGLGTFVELANTNRNDSKKWQTRARWLGVPSPEEREQSQHREHGTQPYLHCCAEYVLEHRDDNPVQAGHRAVVYFSLAKMLSNCSQFDSDEALQMMLLVNDSSLDPIPEEEMRRILSNAERGAFTSTGCDDPLFSPYADPACPIAHQH